MEVIPLDRFWIISMVTLIMVGVICDYSRQTDKIITENGIISPVHVERKIVKIKDEKIGVASYYDYVLKDGWSSVGHLVCATRDFPRYSMIKVTNLDNGKTVVCKKTDHGPDAKVHPDRVVDLSSTAFSALAPLSSGLIKRVKIEKL